MTGIIIATIGFSLSIVALVIALIAKNRENERLKEEARKNWRDHFYIQPRYERFHKFLVVSSDLTEYLRIEAKRLEEEGYKYNKDESFPTVLCFTKYVKVEDETPSES